VVVKTFLLAFAGTVGAIAAPPAIGIITASGHFTLDRSEIWGNATLFDGEKVETTNASSDIALRNGVRLQLGGSSKADVSERRMILFKGVGQVSATNAYEVDAGSLRVRPAGIDARVNIAYAADGTIEVAAVKGEARVTLSGGALLASISSGQKRSFALQNAAGRPIVHKGCLVAKEGRFEMQDQDTEEVIEVAGAPSLLSPAVGNRVTATGTASDVRPSVTPATSVMNATTVSVDARGGCLGVAGNLNASTEAGQAGAIPPPAPGTPAAPPPAGTPAPTAGSGGGGGLSTAAKIGIVAAVAGGGAGAAIALSGHKSSTSP
jgi:hypothetical protein